MKKKRIISLFMAAVILCAVFSGCSLFGGKTVMKIGGNRISEDIYSYALLMVDSEFQQSYGMSFASLLDTQVAEGVTGADMLKGNADNLLLEFAAMRILAEDNGIKLDSEDKKALKESKQAQIEQAGGKKEFLSQLKESGITESAFDYMAETQYIFMNVYSELFRGEGKYTPKISDIAEKVMNNYVRVKHVLVLSSEGDADEAEKKAKAEDIAKRAKAGEDFDKLISELGEDPGMTSNPEGYLLDKDGRTPDGNSMVAEFTAASNALAVDGVSDVVKTSHGYHIIKRYPLTEEYLNENAETYVDMFAYSAFGEKMSETMQSAEIEHTKAYDEIDLYEVFGVEKPLGAGAEAEGEHSEGDGHDHGTEGEADALGGIEQGEVVPAQ